MTFNPSAPNQKIIDGVVVLSEFDPDSLDSLDRSVKKEKILIDDDEQ